MLQDFSIDFIDFIWYSIEKTRSTYPMSKTKGTTWW